MSPSVVCGVDGSPESRCAVEVARWLARGLHARPVLVHATDERPGFPYGDQAATARRSHGSWVAARRLFDDLAGRAEDDEETVIAGGDPGPVLARVARETDAILVAVGSRGRGPLRAALLGSTSHSAVRECDCPVVIVSSTATKHWPPEGTSLLCGVDGTEPSRHALRAAAALRARLGLHLVLAHVQVPGSPGWMAGPGAAPPLDYDGLLERSRDAAEQIVTDAASELGSSIATDERVEAGEVCDQLDRAAIDEDVRLIVIGARGLGALAGAALGSVSARLAAGASRPVLVVRDGVSLVGSSGRGSG